MPKPLKRHMSLRPVSREHHHGLLLSWKIRQGLKLDVDPVRIKKYVSWFWRNHLLAHFRFEEKYIFPIIGTQHPLIMRALQEHEQLTGLFNDPEVGADKLSLLEKLLVAHIRFEERILFQEIEKEASKDQMEVIEKEHAKSGEEEWEDEFWAN